MRSNNSPWLHNLQRERKIVPMNGQVNFDICILGGGIAGLCTAYEILKSTDKTVCVIEGDKVAHGATGHNAGYVVPEFEKSFKDLTKEYGLEMAKDAILELEDSFEYFLKLFKKLDLPVPEIQKSTVAFSNEEHFLKEMEEEYLKYGKIKNKVYVHKDSKWLKNIPDIFLKSIEQVEAQTFLDLLGDKDRDALYFHAIILDPVVLANSALFTERLAKYCLENFHKRFEIFENSYIHSIRLLQNDICILDSASGVCFAKKVVLCTNGFENFNIYGPYGMKIDKEFHHNIYGLIGYMSATFVKESDNKERIGLFYEESYNHKNMPIYAGPYIYFSKRHFSFDNTPGFLWSIGGPEHLLKERIFYDKRHPARKEIYKELDDFQKKHLGVKEDSQFHWHGLMGYTKSGVRVVGQDKRFVNLFYNLGCNGIGIIPSVAGGRRIAKLIMGQKLKKSVFDPR